MALRPPVSQGLPFSDIRFRLIFHKRRLGLSTVGAQGTEVPKAADLRVAEPPDAVPAPQASPAVWSLARRSRRKTLPGTDLAKILTSAAMSLNCR